MMAAWREALSDPARCRELWRQYGSINGVARAVGCSYHTAKRYLAQAGIEPGMRTDGGEKPPVELEPEQPRISVTKEGDTEVFLIDGVSYRIPLETKRQIYALYSRDGGNVQVADIELEFGIPRAAFEAIKRYWGLTHSSLMWPDEDIAERDPDELVEEGLANRKRLLHRRFKARERSWYKEQYEKLAQRASLEDRLIEVARDVLPAWTPPRVIVPYRRADARRRLLIALTDWHTGKRTLALMASPGFSIDILRNRVERLKEGVARVVREVSFGIEEVIVAIHGDMLDNPFGTTYPRQDRGQDLHDWQQLLESAKLLADFLYSLAGMFRHVHVASVDGNHDRTFSTAAVFMAMQLLRDCPNVTFELSETPFVAFERGRNRFIALHGETLRRGGTARENDIMKAIMMLGKPGYRHYVTSGHLHHRQVLQNLATEGTGFEYFLCPSMVGGDEYSEHRMFSTSRPAQLALMVDDDEGVLYPRTIYVD